MGAGNVDPYSAPPTRRTYWSNWAAQRAADDVVDLARRAEDPLADRTGGVILLADGAAYSPSWRVLRGGEMVWEKADHWAERYGELAARMIEVYGEELDLLLSERLPSAYWDDGCLMLDLSEVVTDDECAADRRVEANDE
jgi:hypothetical protein